MRRVSLLALLLLLLFASHSTGQGPPIYTVPTGGESALPSGGSVDDHLINTGPGVGAWGLDANSTIKDEGDLLTKREILRFNGTGVDCQDVSSETVCTITTEAGSGLPSGGVVGEHIVNTGLGTGDWQLDANNQIKDEEATLTKRQFLRFNGAGVSCVDTLPDTVCTIAGTAGGLPSGGTAGQHVVNLSSGVGEWALDSNGQVKDEGVDLTKRGFINFVGAGVSCVDNSPNTDCTIAGAAGLPGGGSVGEHVINTGSGTGTWQLDAYSQIMDEGTVRTKRGFLNFVGTGVECLDDPPNTTCNISAGSGSGLPAGGAIGEHVVNTGIGAGSWKLDANSTIKDEASTLTNREFLRFNGAGVTCADSSTDTICTIPGGAADDLGDHTATQDINLQANRLIRPVLGLDLASTPALKVGTTEDAITLQTWEVGPMNVCTGELPDAASTVAQQNACNDGSDCPSGSCVRAGTNGTLVQETVVIGMDETRAAVFTDGFAQDNVYSSFCYNLGESCTELLAVNSDYHGIKINFETDYRIGAASNQDDRNTEYYHAFFPADNTISGWHLRTPFWATNMKPFPNRFSQMHTVSNFPVGSWMVPRSDRPNSIIDSFAIGGLRSGSNTGSRSSGGVTPSGNALPYAFTIHTGTSWPLDDPGINRALSTHQEFNSALDVRYILDQQDAGTVIVNNTTAHYGANSWGACDGNGTAPGAAGVGEKCVTNRDCNAGDIWHATNDPGICVKGDGVDDTGTMDGVCVSFNDDFESAISGLCPIPTAGEVVDGCDGEEPTTSQCVDIQRWYLNQAAALIVNQITLSYDEVNTEGQDGGMTFGYCGSLAGGSVEDEGRPCVKDSQCASAGIAGDAGPPIIPAIGACVKDVDGPTRANSIIVEDAKYLFDFDGDEAHKNNNTSGEFDKGEQDIGFFKGKQVKLSVTGDADIYIDEIQLLHFLSPTISGGTHTVGRVSASRNRDAIIKIDDQWGAVQSDGSTQHTDWVPTALHVLAQTAIDPAVGEWTTLRFDSANWNTGLWTRQHMRTWVDETNHVHRVMWDNDNGAVAEVGVDYPGAEDQGDVWLHSSGHGKHGVMHWGISDAGSSGLFDSGTKICAQYALTCVRTGLLGSGTDAGCFTNHADNLNFWVMCQ